MIVIDHREHALLKCSGLSPDIQIKNLTIGDIHILSNTTTDIVVIERKTHKDLVASIKDTRWREQKIRLLESGNTIMYIIECDDKNTLDDSEKALCESAILNAMIRDKICVYMTRDVAHTMSVVDIIHRKLCSGKFEEKVSGGVASIKKSKKTMENILAHQLNVIPGISMNIALKISEKYKTMNDLVKEAEISGAVFIKDIPVGKKNIGKKLSEKVYECIFGFKSLEP